MARGFLLAGGPSDVAQSFLLRYSHCPRLSCCAWQGTKDAWISSRLRTGLVFNASIRSVNYTIETVNKSVYLIGSARSQTELDEATTMARNTPDVKRVVSYVDIRPGVPVAAQPA